MPIIPILNDPESGQLEEEYTTTPRLPSGVSQAGSGGPVGFSLPSNDLFGDDEVYSLLRQLGLLTQPVQEAQITEATGQATRRAAGSIPAITSRVLPQIANLRRQLDRAFESVSKRLGPRGGGQVERGEGEALGDFGLALQSLLTQGVIQGQSDRMSLTSGFRPVLQSQLPQLASGSAPGDPALFGAALGEIIPFAQGLFGPSPSPFVPNPALLQPALDFASVTSGPSIFGPFE